MLTVGGKQVFGYNENAVLAFESGLSIDADGSPHAYHPAPQPGLDFLANAGEPGNWWALVTDNGQSNGNPLIQGPGDPAPGYYISTTTLEDPSKSRGDARRYVDSETIPFVALPPKIKQFFRLGDIGMAFNKVNQARSFFIFADIGPGNHIGEGSIKLAENLGINNNARHGGTDGKVVYLLFGNSGDRAVKTAEEIDTIGNQVTANIDIEAILADFA